MECDDCGAEFKIGHTVYEYTSGIFDGEMVIADECFEKWCKVCDDKRGER
jgi:hypothetical protein